MLLLQIHVLVECVHGFQDDGDTVELPGAHSPSRPPLTCRQITDVVFVQTRCVRDSILGTIEGRFGKAQASPLNKCSFAVRMSECTFNYSITPNY